MADKERKEETDPIAKSIGHVEKYQLWICAVVFMMKFTTGWHQLATIFLAPIADFECAEPDKSVEKCSENCTAYKYDKSLFENTAVMEWDLVCDKKYLAAFSQTCFMFGNLIGSIIFGVWADKSGRRIPLIISLNLQLIAGILNAGVPWYWLYCLMRFIVGATVGGSMVTSFVIILEIIGVKNREILSVLYQVPFNMGHMLLPVFAYYLRDWKQLQFSLSVVSALYISYWCLLPESPRWLLAQGRIDEAVAILEKAAKVNGRPTEGIRRTLEQAHRDAASRGEQKKSSIIDLFRYPNLRMKSLVMLFDWFTCGMCFYGISQYISQLGGNIFVNVLISGSLALPGTLITVPMCRFWGRKISMILANLMVAVSMLLIVFVPSEEEYNWATVALGSLGVCGCMSSFCIVYLYGGEIFPTVVRNGAMGLSSMIARIGSMMAPFVSQASEVALWIPPVVFGVIPLIAALLTCLLPETNNTILPESIEDGEEFGKKKK